MRMEPEPLPAGDRPVRVVIVEDHTLVRQSLAKIVASEPGFEVAGEAGRADDALVVVATTRPDLVMLDIALPGRGGLEVAAHIRRVAPEIRLLILTMHDDRAIVSRALAVGADGYVLKTSSIDEVCQALRAVARGESYLSPAIARQVMSRAGGRGGTALLTDRESEILRLLAQGSRPAEMAAALFVSVKTVRSHLANIYAKMGVQTATQAVSEAFRLGLAATGSTEPARRG